MATPSSSGTEIRSQASEPETAQAVIPNDPSGANGVYDPIYDPKRLSTKKATAVIACLGMIEGAFHPHRVNWVIRKTRFCGRLLFQAMTGI